MNKKYYVYSLDTRLLNFLCFVFLFIAIIPIGIINKNFDFSEHIVLTMLFFIPWLVLHELLHALSYILHGAKLKNIYFGAHLEKGILCCLCKQNVSKKAILISLLYPFVLIGVITYIIGIIFENYVLVGLSILNISGCTGDLVMLYNFIRLGDFEYSEFDNPTAFGLYSRDNLSNKKMFGLRYVESKSMLDINKSKRVIISTPSIIFFIFFMIITIVSFIYS